MTHIRPILSTLLAEGKISQDEYEMLLDAFGQAMNMSPEKIKDISSFAQNGNDVAKQILDIFTSVRENEDKNLTSRQPMTEKTPPAKLVNEMQEEPIGNCPMGAEVDMTTDGMGLADEIDSNLFQEILRGMEN